MPGITALFRNLVSRIDLVRRHAFNHGFDDGDYFNFTFGTQRPADLWRLIQDQVLRAPEHAAHLARASMAMCSTDDEWNDYVQLYHWDPEVPVVPVALDDFPAT
jgi:hypothetical protein